MNKPMTWGQFNLALKVGRKYGKRVKLLSPLEGGGVRVTYMAEQERSLVEKYKDYTLSEQGEMVAVT